MVTFNLAHPVYILIYPHRSYIYPIYNILQHVRLAGGCEPLMATTHMVHWYGWFSTLWFHVRSIYVAVICMGFKLLGGASPACPTPRNREIDFDSFVRAGEAKLCGCVRHMPPQRWACCWGEVLLLAGCFLMLVAAVYVHGV